MNGYPIVHTSANPLRTKTIHCSIDDLDAELYNFLFTNKSYTEVHDIQVKLDAREGAIVCLILYKLKYDEKEVMGG